MDYRAANEAKARTADVSAQGAVLVIDSARLFASHKEIQIRHQGKMYRLLITRNGKLILNK